MDQNSVGPAAPVADNGHSNKKKIIKIAIIASLVVLVLASLGVFGLRARRIGFTNRMVDETVSTLAIQSDRLVAIAQAEASPEQLRDLSREARGLDSTVKSRLLLSSQVTRTLNDAALLDIHEEFLRKFGAYIALVADYSGNIPAVGDEELSALIQVTEEAKAASSKARGRFRNLSRQLPDEVFTLEATVAQGKDNYEAAQAEKERQEQLTQQEVADREAAEDSTRLFVAAFVKGDAREMRRYMTANAIGEYEFAKASPASRAYAFPQSFRIVNSKKVGAGFEVLVNITYKVRDPDPDYGLEQYTNSLVYYLVSSGGSWKVDTERFGY